MKLLDKIKNALFEEDEEEKNEQEEIAKKVDIKKTVDVKNTREFRNRDIEEEIKAPKIEVNELPKKTVMFEDEEFIEPTVIEPPKKVQMPKEEVKKPTLYGMKKEEARPMTSTPRLYGGYEEKPKEKFSPSPIISPVYGVLEKNYKVDPLPTKEVPITKPTTVVAEPPKKPIDFDEIREKAYGAMQEEPEKNLLFDMEEEEKPGIEKVTIGDAEEYFNDLGLEYNIDYKDAEKERMTRIVKNKELSEIVDEEIKEDKKIEEEKPKRGRKTKIVDIPITEEDDIKPNDIDDEVDEKNLYDLIDMMYDSKEE